MSKGGRNMDKRDPIFEKSRSVENVYNMRLTALLRELVRDGGFKGAAEALGLDQRTVARSYRRGALSRRVRAALERGLQEGEGSAAAVQRERNDELAERLKDVEGRLESQGQDAGRGLSAVKGEVTTLREAQAQGFRQLERRLAQLEGGSESSESRGEGTQAKGVGGQRKRKSAPWRKFPDMLTLEPVEGDEEVFGDAWSLIVEWRKLRGSHPGDGKGLAWLRNEERLLATELTLLEEHGLTLPPEEYPLRDFARNGQITWRRTALYDTRRALRKREVLRWALRFCTFRLWPR